MDPISTFSQCMARVQRRLAKHGTGMYLPDMSSGGGGEISVEFKNGSTMVIDVPMDGEENRVMPRLTVTDYTFMVHAGLVCDRAEDGYHVFWLESKWAKLMAYEPDDEVQCTQDVAPDGTVFAVLKFMPRAWDDMYDAIVKIHRASLQE